MLTPLQIEAGVNALRQFVLAGEVAACDQAAATIRAWWEACGPWVPDEDLRPGTLLVKRQFEAMLADPRLTPCR